MNVAVGSDHAGLLLKPAVLHAIQTAGHTPVDCGAFEVDPNDDYPDFAEKVARAVLDGRAERGILVCGSGVGASIAANKFRGIRSALCHDTFSARQGVEDDSMNVLALGARVIGPALAGDLVRSFLGARFSALERHQRRLEKVNAFDSSSRA